MTGRYACTYAPRDKFGILLAGCSMPRCMQFQPAWEEERKMLVQVLMLAFWLCDFSDDVSSTSAL